LTSLYIYSIIITFVCGFKLYIACFLRYDMLNIFNIISGENMFVIINHYFLFMVINGHTDTVSICIIYIYIWSAFCYISKAHISAYDKREIVISFISCARTRIHYHSKCFYFRSWRYTKKYNSFSHSGQRVIHHMNTS